MITTGQITYQTDNVEIIVRQTEDLSNQTRWTWAGVGDLYEKWGGGSLGKGRPMERGGPHAPADHNRGLIMSA